VIRKAEIKDIPAVIEMLREQIPETHLKLSEKGFSSRKIANIIRYCIKQGYVWVYEKDLPIGVLLAEKRHNLFSDWVEEVHLLAIYVKHEYRKGIAAGRLLKEFIRQCDDEEIPMIWIGSHKDSDLNEKLMGKLGFKLQEKFYLKER